MQILVLEASTTSAKALVYEPGTGVVDLCNMPYPPEVNDVATHDAEGELEILLQAGRRVAQGRNIAMIALVGTWHSLMLADQTMNPLTRIQTWAYVGAAPTAARLREDEEQTARYYHRTGCMVNAIYPAFKLLHLKKLGQLSPEARVCSQSDYIFHGLTGDWSVSKCIASGSGLLNIHSLEYDQETLELIGLKPEQLPPLRDHSYTAPLCRSAAEALGIRPGIPVAVGNSDGAMNQAGAGALKPGVMTLSVGTSGALRMAFDRPVIPEKPSTWCYYAPGKWLSGAATNGATNCVDWFRQKMLLNKLSFGDLEAAIPTGTQDYPFFLPFPYGERCPGWKDNRLASFHGVNGSHNVGQLYLALLEGVLFNIYHCYEILTRVGGRPDSIQVSGGILNSALWTQMLADILQRDICCPDMEQASMLGGVAVALYCLGELKDVSAFQVDSGRIISPNPDKADFYQERFQRYLHYYQLEQV